jgi:molybdopterin-guanine dinucleotide biosynthesis protein A
MNYPENFTPSHFPPVYLLAGGASRRMGRDKAMLEIKGEKLLVLLAAAATRLCGRATVVAPAGRYESLGLRVIEDKREGAGPLAGIEAALLDSSAEWTIVWACDMPGVTESWLRRLAAKAEVVPPEVLCVASGESLAEANPLCAAWGASGECKRRWKRGNSVCGVCSRESKRGCWFPMNPKYWQTGIDRRMCGSVCREGIKKLER